jgi:hypothetical protein
VVHLEGSTRLGQNPCSDGRFSGAWLPGGVPTGIIWPSKRNSVNNPLIYCEKRKSPYAEMAVAVLKRQEKELEEKMEKLKSWYLSFQQKDRSRTNEEEPFEWNPSVYFA